MHTLSANDILQVSEWAQSSMSQAERNLALFELACPAVNLQVLSALPLGVRDKQILKLRERSFGRVLAAYTDCPACSEGVEFSFNGEDIMPDSHDKLPEINKLLNKSRSPGNSSVRNISNELSAIAYLYDVKVDGYDISFRLPNSTDLLSLNSGIDANTASEIIMKRCVSQVVMEGEAIAYGKVPENILDKLINIMSDYDTHADVVLSMNCPSCEYKWQSIFDIGDFLWSEIVAKSKYLVREVAILARTYGWSEADILSMTSTRRNFYLEAL